MQEPLCSPTNKNLSNQKPISEYGSKEWANELLSYAIRVLQGKCFLARWEVRLQYALLVKADLSKNGFLWQAWILENWIHRLQPRRCEADSSKDGGGVSSGKGILPIAKSRVVDGK